MGLKGVDLAVREGAVCVLVGQNAVGKTTAFNVLLDLVVADSGTDEPTDGLDPVMRDQAPSALAAHLAR